MFAPLRDGRIESKTKRNTNDPTPFIVFLAEEAEEIVEAKARYLLFNKVQVLFNFKQDSGRSGDTNVSSMFIRRHVRKARKK